MYHTIIGGCLAVVLLSCQKYLDIQPDKKQQIPATLQDAAALLANTQVMNTATPGVGEIASDNIYVETADWAALRDPTSRNAYIWGDDLFNESERNDWALPYQAVLYANMALETLEALPEAVKKNRTWQQLKGEALFFRAFAYYGLAQVFCPAYSPQAAALDWGLPLRRTASVEEPLHRSTVGQTYTQILQDLQAAAPLLEEAPRYKTQPSRPATYALLARTRLVMGDYEKAQQYADSCLRLYGRLLDYNTLDSRQPNPFPRFNEEVLFHAELFSRSILSANMAHIDTLLYRSYEAEDLRLSLFFSAKANGGVSFRGSYMGSAGDFSGLATDEVYLIRAEGRARGGDVSGALEDLNRLLLHRYRKGAFIPRTASTAGEALEQVLEERRKQLLYRGLRWTDLRRLNKEPQRAITLYRYLNNRVYALQPGDLRYVFPIPNKVIHLSGLAQNPR